MSQVDRQIKFAGWVCDSLKRYGVILDPGDLLGALADVDVILSLDDVTYLATDAYEQYVIGRITQYEEAADLLLGEDGGERNDEVQP